MICCNKGKLLLKFCYPISLNEGDLCMFNRFKIFLLAIFITFAVSAKAFAAEQPWVNDLRKLFLSNAASIYELNIRTFNAQDTNKNGIIEFDLGEESGNFINAIDRLDELQALGINTIHVQPITPVGKTKALGTAGSIYAAASFNTINPQFKNSNSDLTLEEQAKKFISEAHKRDIRVIIDLPACGSYDLYLQQPELFVKDKNGQPVVPADWTDVRLLNAGTEDKINHDVYNLYKDFVDMVMNLGADGIRADVAPLKPAKFWKELIDYSRKKDMQFMWLAETSDSWTTPVSKYGVYTPYNKLLEAGFDGYYGSWFELKNWRTANELYNHIKFNRSLLSKYKEPKAVIGSFSTHDEMSPVLINGTKFSEMILWLNATLPLNAYFVDGFQSGDNYIYFWANKKAPKTYTDDDYYFVHRGKIDIFNFSRRPGGSDDELSNDFMRAVNFKRLIAPVIQNGKFTILKTTSPEVFAYALSYDNKTVLVFGNLNFSNINECSIRVPKYSDSYMTIPIRSTKKVPRFKDNKFEVKFEAGEIMVLLVEGFNLAK